MFKSLLGGVFQDINNWITTNVSGVGMGLLIGMLSIIALFLLSNIIMAAVNMKKPKLKIKWGQLFLLIIVVGILIWLCVTYY